MRTTTALSQRETWVSLPAKTEIFLTQMAISIANDLLVVLDSTGKAILQIEIEKVKFFEFSWTVNHDARKSFREWKNEVNEQRPI